MPLLLFEVPAFTSSNKTENQLINLNQITKISPHPDNGKKDDTSVIYFSNDHFVRVDEKYEDLKARILTVNPQRG